MKFKVNQWLKFKFLLVFATQWCQIYAPSSAKHRLSSKTHGLTHWGRVTHICVSKLIIIGSDNGLSPGRRQAIIWTNAGILLIGPLATNFSEILIEIYTFSFKKMHLKMSSGKWWPSCLCLNVLKWQNNLNVAENWCGYWIRQRIEWFIEKNLIET